jgi:hypothetical protein
MEKSQHFQLVEKKPISLIGMACVAENEFIA